jgi:acylphosphatase
MAHGAAMRAEIRRERLEGGFADAVLARARELGLHGWVREDGDGAIRLHAEGDAATLAELRAFLVGAAGADEVRESSVKPEGHEQFAVRGVAAGAFVVRAHADRFDLELEVGGATRSWTLRKSPSMDPAVRRMAIETAASQPASGATVWDSGPYEQGGRVPWPEALDRGHAVFVLHGSTLRGGFALQRTRQGSPSQWLLIKRRDAFSS